MKFISYIKNYFFKKKLNFLDVKDIVWAKRYDTEEEKNKIEEGHRESPFIIIKRNRRKIYALECCGNKNSKSLQLLKLQINQKYGYNLKKSCFVFVGRLILLDENRFISKMGTIDDVDLNRIYKSIYLIKQRYKKFEIEHIRKKDLKFKFEVGDIVLHHKQMFYINYLDNDFYYCNQIHETNKGKITITINDIPYLINFSGNKKISKASKIKLLNMTDEKIQDNISYFINKKRKKKNISSSLSRGKLVRYNDEYYLIYGEYQDKLLVYKIYLDRNREENMCKISIKKGFFYTLFEELELSKNENIKIIKEAKESEMCEIKKLKLSIKKSKKDFSHNETLIYKSYKPGYIMIEFDTLDKYVIIKRNHNKIIYSRIDDLINYLEFDFETAGEFNFEISEKMDKFEFNKILDAYRKFSIKK